MTAHTESHPEHAHDHAHDHDHPHGHDHGHDHDHGSGRGGLRVTATEDSPVAWTVVVEVGAERVGKAFERAYRELGRSVRMKGFRQGKVPRPMLEKLYAASVAEQLEHTLVQDTLPEAIEQSGIQLVSEPAVEATPPAVGAGFRYTLRVEVKPKFELPDLVGLPALRPAIDVSDEEVEKQLEELRSRNAPAVEEPEGIRAATGHILQIDFVGRIDGKAFEGGSGQDVELELGSGRFLPGFEEQLVGVAAGDDVEVQVGFPADYGNAALAGKQARFACHVAALKRRQVPELDDEFAKDMGDFENLAALRQRIRDDLSAARERESKQILRRSLLDALIERTAFVVPGGMIERQLEQQLRMAHQRLHGQLPDEAIHEQLGQWREQWRESAERDVRESLILEAVATAHAIAAEDAEVEARIAELAGTQGVGAQALQRAYGDVDLKRAIASQLVDEKTLALLADKAKVEETTRS